jgi:predicted RND superfamily exporter protein
VNTKDKENFLKDLPDKVKKNLVETGSLMPVVFLFTKKGVVIMGIPEFPKNVKDKENLVNIIREKRQEEDADGVVMVCESWLSVLDKDSGEAKNKKEIVFIREEYKNKVAKMTIYDIKRDESGKVVDLVYSDSFEEKDGVNNGGVFTGFFDSPEKKSGYFDDMVKNTFSLN